MGAHYILPARLKEEKSNPFSRSEIRNGGGVGGLVVPSSFSELSLHDSERPSGGPAEAGGDRGRHLSKPSVNTDLKVRLKSGRKRKVCRLLPKKLLKGHPSVSGARPPPYLLSLTFGVRELKFRSISMFRFFRVRFPFPSFAPWKY